MAKRIVEVEEVRAVIASEASNLRRSIPRPTTDFERVWGLSPIHNQIGYEASSRLLCVSHRKYDG